MPQTTTYFPNLSSPVFLFLPSSLNAHLIFSVFMLSVIHVLITLAKSCAVYHGAVMDSDGNAMIFIAFFIYHGVYTIVQFSLKKQTTLSSSFPLFAVLWIYFYLIVYNLLF